MACLDVAGTRRGVNWCVLCTHESLVESVLLELLELRFEFVLRAGVCGNALAQQPTFNTYSTQGGGAYLVNVEPCIKWVGYRIRNFLRKLALLVDFGHSLVDLIHVAVGKFSMV